MADTRAVTQAVPGRTEPSSRDPGDIVPGGADQEATGDTTGPDPVQPGTSVGAFVHFGMGGS